MFLLVVLMQLLLLLETNGNVYVIAIAMRMERIVNLTQYVHQELNSTQELKNVNVLIQAIIMEMVHAELVENMNSTTNATKDSTVLLAIDLLEEDV